MFILVLCRFDKLMADKCNYFSMSVPIKNEVLSAVMARHNLQKFRLKLFGEAWYLNQRSTFIYGL